MEPKKKDLLGRWPRVGLLLSLFLSMVLSWPTPSGAQVSNPWDSIEGKFCFEQWTIETMYRVNGYQGSADFNARKPWRINPYGVLEGNPRLGPRSTAPPEDFHRYNSNKYWWMWDHYSPDPVAGWSLPEWNESRVPPLRDYVWGCLGQAGGRTSPMPMPSSPAMAPSATSVVPPPAAVSPPSVMGEMPQAQIPPAGQAPSAVRVRVAAYGKDETDGSDVGWNSPYPNPSFDDDPARRGYPNARWQGTHYWQGDRLCLAIKNLEAPYPPSHTLAIGYTVTLQGAAFEDGSATKTFILYRFSGVPGQKNITECYRVTTAAPAMRPTPLQGGLLEELIVPNTRPEKVLSRTVLEVGNEYIIEASGTWDDWGNTPHGVDAVWCFAEWRCGREGEAWNQLRLDGKGMTEIAGQTIPYNPQHIYRIRYKGQGKPVEFYSSDALTSWSDNLGAITVRIYGSGVATEPAPQPVPTMPLTPATTDVGVDLGVRWQEEESGWMGEWTRRGTSNVFDAVWTRGSARVTAVMTISIVGNAVRVERRQSSEGSDCDYTGTLAADGITVSGTYRCPPQYPGPYSWRAEIIRGRMGGMVPSPLQALGFGSVLENNQVKISRSSGGSINLAGGARLDIPAGAIDGETEVWLVRSEEPGITVKGELMGDVYYLASTEKVRVKGNFALTIPYDKSKFPPGVSEDSLQAYAVFDSKTLYTIPSRMDKSRQVVVIQYPEVTVLQAQAGTQSLRKQVDSPPALPLSGEQQGPEIPPRTGYVLGKPGLACPGAPKCKTGAPGDIYEEEGHAFRILFVVQAPHSFAKFISDTLQEAYNTYNMAYPDAQGKGALSHLSPDNRMVVQLTNIGTGAHGLYQYYLSWKGYIMVDAAKGQKNREELRDTLFHELFHAVQDVYANMIQLGWQANWWAEATAEWAGHKARNEPFSTLLKRGLGTYPYVFSVPIQESGKYDKGRLTYAYAPLIEHVEKQKPGYLRETFNWWKSFRLGPGSGELYAHLVAQGKLEQTYPDFIKDILANTAADPKMPTPWTQASIFELDDETIIYTRPNPTIGDKEDKKQMLKDNTQRFTLHHFSTTLAPLSSRFFPVRTTGLREPRTVELWLKEAGQPSDKAWLLTTLPEESKGNQAPARRLSSHGASFPGLGQGYKDLWVAVFNPDPNRPAAFELTIRLKKTEEEKKTERLVLLEKVFMVKDVEKKEYIPGNQGVGPTSTWQIANNEFTFTRNKTEAKITITWDDMPTTIEPLKRYPFLIRATTDEETTQLVIYPVVDIASWLIDLKESSKGVENPALNVYRLTLKKDPDKPQKMSGHMRLDIAVGGKSKAINLGEKKIIDPTGDISNVENLFLEIELIGLAKIHWAYGPEKKK